MEISYQSVLSKMEREIHRAKLSEKSAEWKQHVHTIQVMCEMLLDEPNGYVNVETSVSIPSFRPTEPTIDPKEVKLETEDGANGNSIFDF